MNKKFGTIAILGAPNAGKSTLVNALVGEKVSIVTHKVQTTRMRLLGIAMHKNTQMVLIDTPGIFAAKKSMDRTLVGEAWAALDDADVIVLMVDAARKTISQETESILHRIREWEGPKLLVLNKVDQANKENLLRFSAQLNDAADFQASFMISALNGSGLPDVKDYLAVLMPEGDWVYDPDMPTTAPIAIAAAEITREKLFLACHQEIPYSTAVITDHWAEEDGRIVIHQSIILERDSQKGVVIGKGGAMLKKIGSQARAEIIEMVGDKVHLDIRVKVDRDWTNKPRANRLLKAED